MLILALILTFFQFFSEGRGCFTNSECRSDEQCVSGACLCLADHVLYAGRCITNNGICTGGEQVYFNGQCYYTAQVGSQCWTSHQCLGGAECFNSQCICSTGTTNTNGICVPQNGPCSTSQLYVNNQCYSFATVGQSCQIAAQCLGGTTCTQSSCQCPTGTTLVGSTCQGSTASCSDSEVSVNGVCVARVKPGQACQNTLQCYDAAECGSTNLCVCAWGMYLVGDYCRKLQPSSSCDQATSISVNGQCLAIQKPGAYCQDSAQCLGGSLCSNGYCQCPSGSTLVSNYCVNIGSACAQNQVRVNGRCFGLVSIGQPCYVTEQCQNNTECGYSGICACPHGSQVEISGQCYDLRGINEYCAYNQQCQNGAICQNSYCTCTTGYTWDGSSCVLNSATCGTNQVYYNGYCYNYALIGQSCQVSQQCQGGSTCTNNYCQCPSGTTQQGSQCVSGGATCNVNQVIVNGICYNYASIGQYCQVAQQCQGGSTCTNGYCQCPSGTYQQNDQCVNSGNTCGTSQVYVNGMCYNYASIGQYCQVEQQCQGGSTCTNGYCQCPSGTYQQNDQCVNSGNTCGTSQVYVNGMCYNYAFIGQYCQVAQQCQGGSTCTNGYCQCPSGTYQQNDQCVNSGNMCGTSQVYVNGVCYNLVPIGQYCQVVEQCQGASTCTNNYCQCPAGYTVSNNACVSNGGGQCSPNEVYVNGHCYLTVQVGGYCSYDVQCLSNSSCTSNVCVCPAGTVFSNGVCMAASQCQYYQVNVNGQCLDYVSIGMQCADTRQCTDSATCVAAASGTQMTCQCNSGTIYTGSACVLPSSLSCPYNTVYVGLNNCMPLVSIGQSCSYSAQCMGSSSCVNSVCQCPSGYTVIDGVCRTMV